MQTGDLTFSFIVCLFYRLWLVSGETVRKEKFIFTDYWLL